MINKIKTKRVKAITLYVKHISSGYKYCVDYYYVGEDRVYTQMFLNNKDLANKFLKTLYENISPCFWHYNYAVRNYDKNSENVYFFMSEHQEAPMFRFKTKYIDNLYPLRKAYKNLFGQRLCITAYVILARLKDFSLSVVIALLVILPWSILLYEMQKQEKILKEMEIKVQKAEESEKYCEKLIQEYQTIKTKNTKDELQNIY